MSTQCTVYTRTGWSVYDDLLQSMSVLSRYTIVVNVQNTFVLLLLILLLLFNLSSVFDGTKHPILSVRASFTVNTVDGCVPSHQNTTSHNNITLILSRHLVALLNDDFHMVRSAVLRIPR